MSISGTMLNAPLKISEIASILGVSATNLSALCKSGKINRWAIYKPMDFNKSTPLTIADRKSKQMGLTPKEITVLSGTQNYTGALSNVTSQISEWSYTLPKGGTTSPYRMSDFLNSEGGSSKQGYNHSAVACDNGFSSFQAKQTGALPLRPVTNFSFRLDEQSAGNIGSANSDYMPLSYVCSTANDNWYIGLAIYVSTGTYKGFWFIRGEKSFKEVTSSSDIVYLFPSFATATWTRDMLGNPSSLRYLPVLLKNPQTVHAQEQAQRTIISMSTGNVYCMPSGAGKSGLFSITYNTPYSNTSVSNPINSNIINHLSPRNVKVQLNGGYEGEMVYMIDGLDAHRVPYATEDGVGNTIRAWFLCLLPVFTQYSYTFRKLVLMYCERKDNSSPWLPSTTAPTAALNKTLHVYINRVDSAPSNGAQPNKIEEVWTFTVNPSLTSKVNFTAVDNSYTQSFYGVIHSNQPEKGISLDVYGVIDLNQ